jgi:hypothetical protein
MLATARQSNWNAALGQQVKCFSLRHKPEFLATRLPVQIKQGRQHHRSPDTATRGKKRPAIKSILPTAKKPHSDPV